MRIPESTENRATSPISFGPINSISNLPGSQKAASLSMHIKCPSLYDRPNSPLTERNMGSPVNTPLALQISKTAFDILHVSAHETCHTYQ